MRVQGMKTLCVVLFGLLAQACGGSSGPGAPVIVNETPPGGTVGVAYAGYAFTATGGRLPLKWSSTALPPGLFLDFNGNLTGTPVIAATYTFTVVATDSSNPPMTANAQVRVVIADTQMVLAPATPPAATASYPYAGFQFSVLSGGTTPYAFAVSGGTLPPGMTLTSSGSLSGTPTSAGTYSFTVRVSDAATPTETADQPVTLTVNAPAPPIITTSPLNAAATTGQSFNFVLAESGGYLPLHWSVGPGSLPPGLTMSGGGVISGTPTLAGSYGFTITLTDSATVPQAASAAFTILVTNPPPPVINASNPPTATVGAPYTFTFTASGGLAPLTWSAAGAVPGLTLDSGGTLAGTPTEAGQFPIILTVSDALMRGMTAPFVMIRVSTARPTMTASYTGSLGAGRAYHSATLLTDGRVLVAGGSSLTAVLQSAEIYDPKSMHFTTATEMTEPRSHHAAVLLANSALANYGKVLIVGPSDASAELFDPASATFSATGSMAGPRANPTATLLASGKVLVAGGNASGLAAEIYDPVSATFTTTGPLTTYRTGHSATLLKSGKVLIAGGTDATGAALSSAELFDPGTGTSVLTGSMNAARSGHQATALADGTVLVVGPLTSAEVYDPAKGTFTVEGNSTGYGQDRTATLLSDGTVATVGGPRLAFYFTYVPFFPRGCIRRWDYLQVSATGAERYAPESGGFTSLGTLLVGREGHTATLLADGSLLVVGGLHRYETTHLYDGCNEAVVDTSLPLEAEILK